MGKSSSKPSTDRFRGAHVFEPSPSSYPQSCGFRFFGKLVWRWNLHLMVAYQAILIFFTSSLAIPGLSPKRMLGQGGSNPQTAPILHVIEPLHLQSPTRCAAENASHLLKLLASPSLPGEIRCHSHQRCSVSRCKFTNAWCKIHCFQLFPRKAIPLCLVIVSTFHGSRISHYTAVGVGCSLISIAIRWKPSRKGWGDESSFRVLDWPHVAQAPHGQ
jgi:hypothetical protein